MTRNLLNTINIDVPAAVAEETIAFWSAALGATPVRTRMPNYTILDHGADPNRLVIQTIEDGPPGVHFDVHTDDLDAEIERLVGLGATVVDPQWKDHPGSWVIMRDPAGIEFCLVYGLNRLRGQTVVDDFERRARQVGSAGRTAGEGTVSPPIEDVEAVRRLNAVWALRLSQGDIHQVMEHVFTADGSYSAFGQTYGLADWPALVEAAPKGLFLTGEPVIELDGDTGTGEVPLLFIDQTNHNMRMGWYTDTYERTPDGWRLKTRAMTFLRRHGGADSGKAHDPLRPQPTSAG